MSSQKTSPGNPKKLEPDPQDMVALDQARRPISAANLWQYSGWLFVCIVLLAGAWIRIQVALEPLWLDELHTGYCVVGEGSVLEKAMQGNQGPFYFWLTSAVYHLLNDSGLPDEWKLRSLSLICGFLLMSGAAIFTWRQTKSVVACGMVSFFVAFDGNLIFYATEARPYVLVQLLGLIQAGLFMKLLDRFDWPWATATALTSALLFFSHYTSGTLFLAECIFLVLTACWRISHRTRNLPNHEHLEVNPKAWLGYWMIVACLCSLATPHLLELFARKSYWAGVSNATELASDLLVQSLVWFGPAWCLVMIPVSNDRHTQGQPQIQNVLWFTAWGTLPILFLLACEIFEVAPLALPRYGQVGAVAFALAIPVAVGHWGTGHTANRVPIYNARFLKCGIAIVFVMVCVWMNSYIWQPLAQGSIPTFRNENWKAMMTAAQNAGADSALAPIPLFLFANILEDADARQDTTKRFQDYLRFPINNLYAFQPQILDAVACPTLSDTPLSEAQLRQIRQKRTALLIIRATPERAAFIVDTVQQSLGELSVVSKFGDPTSHLVLIKIDLIRGELE